MEGIALFFITFVLIFLFIVCGIALTIYLLQGFGLYRMAKRLEISYAGLAFVPIGSDYILGKIAETPTKEKKPIRFGIILVLLHLAGMVISFSYNFATSATGKVVVSKFLDGGSFEDLIDGIAELTCFAPQLFVGQLMISAISVTMLVFHAMALYRVFKLFAPDNAVVYLVLSLLFGFMEPIFLFVLRKKPLCFEAERREYTTYGGGDNDFYSNSQT